MAALHRVLQLKERLSSTSQEPRKIAKALKELEETKISLDILVETGIGKTVNSFRKHAVVGDVAKSLVSEWKKLVPQEQSDLKEKHSEKNLALDPLIPKHNKPSDGNEKVSESAIKGYQKYLHSDESKPQNSLELKYKDPAYGKGPHHKEYNHDGPKKNVQPTPDESSKSNWKDCNGKPSSLKSVNAHSMTTKKDTSRQKEEIKHTKDVLDSKSCARGQSLKQNDSTKSKVKMDDEVFDPPTMSFESYLNYDQVSSKRKKKSSPVIETNKKNKTEPSDLSEKNKINGNTSGEKIKTDREKAKSKQDRVSETPIKKEKIENLTDLLNIPLPKFLPDYSILPSPPYEADKGAAPEVVSEEFSDMNCFTGRRLNSKMQVYSGSKPIFLSKMLSLYEQCLRVLQNNIDLLHEVGGVPFEILEPVLERCTPEQLNRIEDCNPSFVEESDHLWKKHCQRDFKNDHLLEYESWREMYMRLFSEREEKLQKITKDISSAHSGKPKGRQVKLAYVHCVAKPPRNIRKRQEIYGTAGPIAQPHPIDRLKMQKLEREKEQASKVPSSPSSSAAVSNSRTSGPNLDLRRPFKRVAPMMAKSMRAFKNRVGPR